MGHFPSHNPDMMASNDPLVCEQHFAQALSTSLLSVCLQAMQPQLLYVQGQHIPHVH
jgi:hypothetical protein